MCEPSFKPILLDLLRYSRLAQDEFVRALDPTQRTAIGLPTFWSAKDHVAHMTYWRQQLNLKLRAIQQATPTQPDDYVQVNPIVFESQRERSWSEILAESEDAYTELLRLVDLFSEEELTAIPHVGWIPDGWPFYIAFMGYCYDHTQRHLVQYASDRHDLVRAQHIAEIWAERVIKTEAPYVLKGHVLYHLACLYVACSALEKASTTLQHACMVDPRLKRLARTNRDLDVLRSHLPGTFYESQL